MSNTHYSAFISYRHHPIDSAVAAKVQHMVERFPIPRPIRKKTGISRIDRVFRDKEELPITVDINEDIGDAIHNSDFLIVICSPRTKESIWVEREIRLFLTTHSRRQILTVLADGDPAEVIPDLLKYDERENPQTGEIEQIPIEPLSCDFRLPTKEARREELPRLMAAILGCPYDELKQRQRQYEMRRLSMIFGSILAGVLIFTAYVIRSNIRIRDINDQLALTNDQLLVSNNKLEESYLQVQANYDEALRNQSHYLATESARSLQSGDRFLATALALKALPDETNDRPFVSEAQQALTDSIHAYTLHEQLDVVGHFQTRGHITDFFLTEDRSRLYAADVTQTIYCFDTATYECLFRISHGYAINQMELLQDRYLLVASNGANKLSSYDGATGEPVWEKELSGSTEFAMISDDTELLLSGAGCVLDAFSGETLREQIRITGGDPDTYYHMYPTKIPRHAEHGQLTAVYFFGDDLYYPGVYDAVSGEATILGQGYSYIEDVCLFGPSRLAVIGFQAGQDLNHTSFSMGGLGASFSTITGSANWLYHSEYRIDAYDTDRNEKLWSNSFSSHQRSLYSLIAPSEEGLYIAAADICGLYDPNTGECLSRSGTSSPGIYASYSNGKLFLITEAGAYAVFEPENDQIVEQLISIGNLNLCSVGNGYFILPKMSNTITHYQMIKDEDLILWSGDLIPSPKAYRQKENLLAIRSLDTLSLYDSCEHKQLWLVPLPSLPSSGTFRMNISEDLQHVYLLYFYNNYSCIMNAFDFSVETGEYTELKIGLQGDEKAVDLFGYDEEMILITQKQADHSYRIHHRHMPDCISSEHLFSYPEDAIDVSNINLLHSPDQTGYRLSVPHTDGTLQVIDLLTGTEENFTLPEGALPSTFDYDNAFSSSFVCDEKGILIYHPDGSTAHIDLDTETLVSKYFLADGKLVVAAKDGTLSFYHADGTLFTTCSVSLPSVATSCIWRYPDENTLCMTTNGNSISLISLTDYGCLADNIPAIVYDSRTDELIAVISGYPDSQIASFRRYSLAQLQEMGRNLIGDYELSSDQLVNYGLK